MGFRLSGVGVLPFALGVLLGSLQTLLNCFLLYYTKSYTSQRNPNQTLRLLGERGEQCSYSVCS